jgi:hypothetical protein
LEWLFPSARTNQNTERYLGITRRSPHARWRGRADWRDTTPKTNANPFTHCLIPPFTLSLPSGDSVCVPRCRGTFSPWQGKPIRDTYGGKAVLEFDRKPVFAELAILGTLQNAGWDGAWVDTYWRTFRRSMPPHSCDLPSHAQRLDERICRANSGKTSGCFDIFAWRKRAYLFVESKRKSQDSIQVTQKAWIEAALRSEVPLAASAGYGFTLPEQYCDSIVPRKAICSKKSKVAVAVEVL